MRRYLALAAAVISVGALAATSWAGATSDAGVVAHSRHDIDLAKAANAAWVALPSSWSALEPEPGSYNDPGGQGAAWDALGSDLAYAHSLGLHTLVALTGAPAWARASGGLNPADPARYAQFLSDFATRLGPLIDAYMPWNEPNQQHFWGKPDPAAYTRLQQAAYPALKGADPTATVLSASVAPIAPDDTGVIRGGGIVAYDWVTAIYQDGIRGSFDALAWNAYPPGPPESEFSDSQGRPHPGSLTSQLYLRTMLDQLDPGRPVWIAELSWSTCVGCVVNNLLGVNEATQADYLGRAWLYRRRYLASGVPVMFWWDMTDGPNPSQWDNDDGLVRHNGTPKPAYGVFSGLGSPDAGSAPPAGSPPAGSPPAGGGGSGGSQGGGGTGTGAPPAGGAPGGAPVPPAGGGGASGAPNAGGGAEKARALTARVACGGLKPDPGHGIALGPLSVKTTKTGWLSLVTRARVTTPAHLRIDGYRVSRWVTVKSIVLRRPVAVNASIRDRGYLAFRLRLGEKACSFAKVAVRR